MHSINRHILTPEESKLGYKLAAEWLEQHTRTAPALLADHFERGEAWEQAAHWYSAATAAAFEADALPEVVRCGEQAVRCGVQGQPLGDVAALVAEALGYGGRQADAAEWAARARLQAAPGQPARWRASQALVAAQIELGLRGQAAATLDDMLASVPGRELTAEAIVALAISATNALIGQLADYGQRILTLLNARGSAGYNARAQGLVHMAASAAAAAVRPERAIHETQQALAQFQSAGSLKDVLQAQHNLGWHLAEAGLLEEAEPQLLSALALADKLGLGSGAADCLTNLGLVQAGRGAPELAEQTLRAALGKYQRLQSPRAESGCRAYLARVVAQRGDWAEAAELARQARDLGAVDPSTQAVALAVSAEVDRQAGLVETALGFARAAWALYQEQPACEHVALIWLALVEALLARGHADEARARLAEALVWLNARADSFESAAGRRAFLTQVPDNASLLSLAERLR